MTSDRRQGARGGCGGWSAMTVGPPPCDARGGSSHNGGGVSRGSRADGRYRLRLAVDLRSTAKRLRLDRRLDLGLQRDDLRHGLDLFGRALAFLVVVNLEAHQEAARSLRHDLD